jgi:hypothetical protein
MKTLKPMATLVLASLIVATSAFADRDERRGGHDRGRSEYEYHNSRNVTVINEHHDHHGNWIVPLVVGGVLGYALSEPRRETVVYASAAPVMYTPQPTYQERWVYFGECDCQRRVLVSVR